MKKFFLLLLIIVLFAFAFTLAKKPKNNNNQPADNGPGNHYANAEFRFAFNYPPDFKLVTPTYGSLSNQIVQAQVEKSAFPGTNFNDAAFTVSNTQSPSIQDCLSKATNNTPAEFKDTQSINSTIYYKTSSREAAAGNIYDSRIFRIYDSGFCIELKQTAHTGSIENYTENNVSEVDLERVWIKLDQLLYTFRFTN